MRAIFRKMAGDFIRSAKEFGKLRTLAACAMLLALGAALDYFGSFYLSGTLKISSTFIAIAAAGYLFGAIPAMVVGGVLDVLMWLIKPAGVFFPGYTLSAELGGLIFGLCLYNRKDKALLFMAPFSKLLINLFVNLGLNTYWSALFTGKGYLALLPARALKNALLWPVESALLIAVLLFLSRNKGRMIR
jgi:ECF transporter S component (folate family)